MKRFLILICLLLACNLLFAEIQWFDVPEEFQEDYTAIATCTSKKEVLEITHVKDLQPYFVSYRTGTDKNYNNYSVYVVYFSKLGFLVEEYLPNGKTIAMYAKTIFQD
jgi:hypothetical protein